MTENTVLQLTTEERTYRFEDGPQKIGRGQGCAVLLLDSKVSRHHATVRRLGQRWLIRNYSSHGLRINGASVEEGELSDGDRVQLGPTQIGVRIVRPVQARKPEPPEDE